MKSSKIYNKLHKASSLFMMITLAWLTISLPFVFATQQYLQQVENVNCQQCDHADHSNDKNNSFQNNNASEEKPPGTNLSEEYIHEFHHLHAYNAEHNLVTGHFNTTTYIAFHGELLVPPPNHC